VDLTSEELDRIVTFLSGGGILGYPTETVYGLGGEPTTEVVEAVRALKGRDDGRPFLVLLPRTEPVWDVPLRWGLSLPSWAIGLAECFWPGPLTLVLSDLEERFPSGVRNASGGVAVRVSSHPFVEALMAGWDRPLISTSANLSGKNAALTAEEVRTLVEGARSGGGVWIVDGGPASSTMPSTLIDCTGERPRLVREGAIPAETLRATLPELVNDGL
jgi:L-threonylcarbamoyladenylate synthase